MKPLIVLALIPGIVAAQSTGQYRGPIIDVHLHAHTRESLRSLPPSHGGPRHQTASWRASGSTTLRSS